MAKIRLIISRFPRISWFHCSGTSRQWGTSSVKCYRFMLLPRSPIHICLASQRGGPETKVQFRDENYSFRESSIGGSITNKKFPGWTIRSWEQGWGGGSLGLPPPETLIGQGFKELDPIIIGDISESLPWLRIFMNIL